MKILILGGAGYLGWPTAMSLSAKGHSVQIVDCSLKGRWETQMGVRPLRRLLSLNERTHVWREVSGKRISYIENDITWGNNLRDIINIYKPDAVIHYAEQPSAPFSLSSERACDITMDNNVRGTLKLIWALHSLGMTDTHIIKLGTMGEYGTPNIDIEEGWIDIHHQGRSDRVLFPKKPGSFYHLTKVHDSANLEYACRTWGLRVTDLNQGIVYGIDTKETLLHDSLRTSFHYDAVFGTVLNRFITQAVVGEPLSVYGKGTQIRGFLNIKDTLACVELALSDIPEKGEFRVFNQFTEQFSVLDLAMRVSSLFNGKVFHLLNPRVEEEEHYYNAINTGLLSLGLNPHYLTNEVLRGIYNEVEECKEEVEEESLKPTITWR